MTVLDGKEVRTRVGPVVHRSDDLSSTVIILRETLADLADEGELLRACQGDDNTRNQVRWEGLQKRIEALVWNMTDTRMTAEERLANAATKVSGVQQFNTCGHDNDFVCRTCATTAIRDAERDARERVFYMAGEEGWGIPKVAQERIRRRWEQEQTVPECRQCGIRRIRTDGPEWPEPTLCGTCSKQAGEGSDDE